MMRRFLPPGLSIFVIAGSVSGEVRAPAGRVARAVADRLGSAHVAGRYNFTRDDYLNEGADQILKLGMRVIKIYLHDPAGSYRFNSRWPKFDDLTQVARHPYYRRLFGKPFTTYIMTAYSLRNRDGAYWRRGVSDEQYARESQEFYELAKYLLEAYRGTGKTFVLQHWEGDWAVRGNTNPEPEGDPSPKALDGMVRWLNARQDGVDRARAEVKNTDVKVYNACEMNLVAIAMDGRTTVVNNVVPRTRCDLYSYSSYDTIGVAAENPGEGRKLFRRALDYIASKAPDSRDFGDKNVFVGEFGWPEVRSEKDPGASTEKCLRVLKMTTEESLAWGCPYVVYWQVFDNEVRSGKARPTNDQCRGFYLVKPDGTRAAAWDYFASLLVAPK